MSRIAQDLRFAVRNLRRQPSLALAAILTLTLGIGANAAIFSLVDSALLTPPPFRQPDRVFMVWSSNPQVAKELGMENEVPASNPLLYDYQKASRTFERFGMAQANRMVLTGQGDPEQLGVVFVTGDFFRVLGTPAEIGRAVDPGDDTTAGKPAVVVLSHALWQRKFGGDPKVVGRAVSLNDKPVTVVGVMPPRFDFPRGGADVPAPYGFAREPDIWAPLSLPADARLDRTTRFNVIVGRLRPGVARATAEAEIQTICQRLAHDFPPTDKGWSAYLQPIVERIQGPLRPALLILWGAVGLVLLIACANVANLLLARAASRQKEIAVRVAMGAGPRRLIAQLLTESGLLSLLGGVLGAVLAWVGLRTFAAFVPTGLVGAGAFSLSGRALAFTAVLCLATCLLAGLVPAFQTTRPDLAGSLREGTRAGAGTAGSHRTRSGLVIAEVALAVLLLVGAGLLLRSFVRLLGVDPGFRPAHVLAFELGLSQQRYAPPQRLPFFQRVLAGVRALPGVTAAAAISDLPMGGTERYADLAIEGKPPKPGQNPVAAFRIVSPEYFGILGIPLRRGRLLTAADRKGTPPVAVIDEAMARTHWPGEDPLGKRFLAGEKPWITVVGVVGSVHDSGLQGELRPEMYQTMEQVQVPFIVRIVARTEGDPAALSSAVRQVVHQVDRDQPVSHIETLDQLVSDSVAKPRFSLLLLGLFAALALALAIVGIYGITAYSVAQRTRELGLRMALGAQPQGILRMVMAETGVLAAIGVVLGLAAALALTRLMASLLYGVGATDPSTLLAVSLGLVLIALAAAYLPGRRATRVDPNVALRTE